VLKLEQLTDEQKQRIEKDLITFKGGKLGLKKVAHDHVDEKLVAQSSTSDVQSESAKMMFADVPKIEASIDDDTAVVSFF